MNAPDNDPIIVVQATPKGVKATWSSTSLCLLSLCVLLLLFSFFLLLLLFSFFCSSAVFQRSCLCTQMHVCLYIFSCLCKACTYRHTRTHIWVYMYIHTAEDAQFGRPRDFHSRRRLLLYKHSPLSSRASLLFCF